MKPERRSYFWDFSRSSYALQTQRSLRKQPSILLALALIRSERKNCSSKMQTSGAENPDQKSREAKLASPRGLWATKRRAVCASRDISAGLAAPTKPRDTDAAHLFDVNRHRAADATTSSEGACGS
jgi:hypothetical protein